MSKFHGLIEWVVKVLWLESEDSLLGTRQGLGTEPHSEASSDLQVKIVQSDKNQVS